MLNQANDHFLISQLVISKKLLSNLNAIDSLSLNVTKKETKALKEDVKKLLKNSDFIAALKELPGNTKLLEDLLANDQNTKELLEKILYIHQKKKPKKFQKDWYDLTDLAEDYYKTTPQVLNEKEIKEIIEFINTQVEKDINCFGLNKLGALSPKIAKFILDNEKVFTKIANDTNPFGAEPILLLGLQAGYCEQKFSKHQFFIQRFLQFAGVRPNACNEQSAPQWAVETILLRTQYYKTIQESFKEEKIREKYILRKKGQAINVALLNKIIDQVIKLEKHERTGEKINKSQEAQYLLMWPNLMLLDITEEKLLNLVKVAVGTSNQQSEQNFIFNLPEPTLSKWLQITKSDNIFNTIANSEKSKGFAILSALVNIVLLGFY